MQIMARVFFEAMRHAAKSFIAWVMEVEKPQCPKLECEGKEAAYTGKVRIFPSLPVMYAGADSWPMANMPVVIREHKCEGCGDKFQT